MDQGFTWLKMDLAIDLMKDMAGHACRTRWVSIRAAAAATAAHVHRHRDDAKRASRRMASYVASGPGEVG